MAERVHPVLGFGRGIHPGAASRAVTVGEVTGVLLDPGDNCVTQRLRATIKFRAMSEGFVPISAGQVSRTALTNYLRRAQEPIIDQIDRLQNMVEMTLMLVINRSRADEVEPAATGRAWLRSRTRNHRYDRDRLDALRDVVGAGVGRMSAHDRSLDIGTDGIDVSLLVPASQTTATLCDLEALVHRLDRTSIPIRRCVIGGPWPPFSFVRLPALPGATS